MVEPKMMISYTLNQYKECKESFNGISVEIYESIKHPKYSKTSSFSVSVSFKHFKQAANELISKNSLDIH